MSTNFDPHLVFGLFRGQLSGMREVGIVEGCLVWRPLLPWRKDAIYGFAHTFGVPYFKDSTPSWSTRYKLRRQLLPLIQVCRSSLCMLVFVLTPHLSFLNRKSSPSTLPDPGHVRRGRAPEPCLTRESLRRLQRVGHHPGPEPSEAPSHPPGSPGRGPQRRRVHGFELNSLVCPPLLSFHLFSLLQR